MPRFLGLLFALLTSLGLAGEAHAEDDPPLRAPRKPVRVLSSSTGVERPASEPGDPARSVADIFLFVPRTAIDFLFMTSGAAAGLVENEQVVPRVKDVLFTPGGEIGVFPTAFVETGFNPNIGARMVARTGRFASTVRAGYGGPDTNVVESRVLHTIASPGPLVLSLEGLIDRRTDLGFAGIGPDPESDPRNLFRADTGLRAGAYKEIRERVIAGVGARPFGDTEFLLSSSFKSRRVDDAPGAGASSISQVFELPSLPGAFRTTRTTYTEIAIRLDTRKRRGPPSAGALLEVYGGVQRGVGRSDGDAAATGGRAAAFIPIYRTRNILSPRIALDGIAPVGTNPLSFNDYVFASDFRGIDGRRDRVAALASLDYRWSILKYVSSKVFAEVATVAPTLRSLNLDHLSHAWGFGVDLHSSSTELGSMAFAFSPDGFRFLFSFGLASGFGDRQHR